MSVSWIALRPCAPTTISLPSGQIAGNVATTGFDGYGGELSKTLSLADVALTGAAAVGGGEALGLFRAQSPAGPGDLWAGRLSVEAEAAWRV